MFLIGALASSFILRRVAGLERELHRRRVMEVENRHDLERLSARLVEAQEQERRALARELHDEVGQALTAIKMEVGVALRGAGGDLRARNSLEEARAIAETTLQGVRDLSQLLHPSTLDDFGLPETVSAYLRSFGKRTGIRSDLSVSGCEERLPPAIEVAIYRILQEALTNVARHSQANRCRVAITRHGGFVDVSVEDNGIGPRRGSAPSRGVGVIGMRERAQSLAGAFSIDAGVSGGTRIHVAIPLPAVTPEAPQALAG
jgi:signal transduction histidine kinase